MTIAPERKIDYLLVLSHKKVIVNRTIQPENSVSVLSKTKHGTENLGSNVSDGLARGSIGLKNFSGKTYASKRMHAMRLPPVWFDIDS